MNRLNPLRNSVLVASLFVAILLLLKLCEAIFDMQFHQLGVYPRTQSGLLGILTAPLIHGSWQHLLGNAVPTVLLGSMMIYGYPRSRWLALAAIWLLSGAGVWLFGRGSYHFGASGLTHGIFFFLFVSGILRRDRRSAALLMIAFYLYGGMLLTIFPRDPDISFESHLFGALAGAACAYAFRNWDPKPARRQYSWEIEEQEDDGIDEGNNPDTNPKLH
jgi:membrane associated rhomboid family serine protease